MTTQTSLEPVVKTITVRCSQERAFDVFTARMGSWWPVTRFSIAADEGVSEVVDVRIDPTEGGRCYEVRADGSEADWGHVVAWEPPSRVAMSWKPTLRAQPSTEWEVVFTAEGPDATRVVLTHTGWERLGEDGPEARESYLSGWDGVLGLYAARAEA
jgi:hypothetical protein